MIVRICIVFEFVANAENISLRVQRLSICPLLALCKHEQSIFEEENCNDIEEGILRLKIVVGNQVELIMQNCNIWKKSKRRIYIHRQTWLHGEKL